MTRSPQWWSEVDRLRNVGAVFSSLNVRDIARIRIPTPALGVQQKIAEALDSLDDKVAANEALSRTANELAESIFASRTPSLWNVPMSSVLTPVLGGTPSRARAEYWHGGIRLFEEPGIAWASAKDIVAAPMGVIADTSERITELAVAQARARPLPAGSVIVTARGTVGSVARLSVPASFNQSCYGFMPGALPSATLYLSLKRAMDRARELAHGSVFDTISMATFDHVLVPDPATSASCIAELEAQVRPLLLRVEGAVAESCVLAAVRDALLPELMSGRLPLKDAEKVVGGVL